ncbi:hypothetical protein pb186bvf_020558 [Paramecium bursaria]
MNVIQYSMTTNKFNQKTFFIIQQNIAPHIIQELPQDYQYNKNYKSYIEKVQNIQKKTLQIYYYGNILQISSIYKSLFSFLIISIPFNEKYTSHLIFNLWLLFHSSTISIEDKFRKHKCHWYRYFIEHQLKIYKKRLIIIMEQSFIEILYNILETQSIPCLTWDANGQSFYLSNTQELEKYLGFYFKHSKFASFQKQLSVYSFKTIKHQNHKQYTHPYFRKGITNFQLVTRKQQSASKLNIYKYQLQEIANQVKQLYEEQAIIHKKIQIQLGLYKYLLKQIERFQQEKLRQSQYNRERKFRLQNLLEKISSGLDSQLSKKFLNILCDHLFPEYRQLDTPRRDFKHIVVKQICQLWD